MVATKKSFKKPHIGSFKLRSTREEELVRNSEDRLNRDKSVGRLKAKKFDEERKRKSKPSTAVDTRRAIGDRVRSVDKSAQQTRPKLLSRKKTQDLTRQTLKKKEPKFVKNEIIRQYLAESSERQSNLSGNEDKGHHRESNADNNLRTNKLNLIRKNAARPNQDTRAQIKTNEKSANKPRKPTAKPKDAPKAFNQPRRSSPSIHKNLSKSQKKLPPREKNLSKAKSMKVLRAKDNFSQGKNIEKITEKLSNKIDKLDKKINVIFHSAMQKPKGEFKLSIGKTKKDEGTRKKLTKRNGVSSDLREPRAILQKEKHSKNQLKRSNKEFIDSLKQLTEAHLMKLTCLFEQYTLGKSSELDQEQIGNFALLMENAKQTMLEYEKKIKEVPEKIISREEETEKSEQQADRGQKLTGVGLNGNFGHSKMRYNIAIAKPQTQPVSGPISYFDPETGVINRLDSLESMPQRLQQKTEEIHSERSSAFKKDQYLAESWRQPNLKIVKRHSKDLLLSNIVKTKRSDEHLRSFDRMKTSQAMLSNLENSESYSVKEEVARNPSVHSETELRRNAIERHIEVRSPISEQAITKGDPDRLSAYGIPEEVIPDQTVNKADQADNITDSVIHAIIDDLFDDCLYRLFFLPDKIGGIKTNYTYCKFYLETLMNYIQGKLIRELQGPSDPEPEHAPAARGPGQDVAVRRLRRVLHGRGHRADLQRRSAR